MLSWIKDRQRWQEEKIKLKNESYRNFELWVKETNSLMHIIDKLEKELNKNKTQQTQIKPKSGSSVPTSCDDCLKKVKVSVHVASPSGWSFSDDNVLDETAGALDITPQFIKTICDPLLREQGERMTRKTKPKFFRHGYWAGVQVAYGVNGMEAELSSYPIEIGGKFSLQLGAFLRGGMDRFGDTSGQAAIGAKFIYK